MFELLGLPLGRVLDSALRAAPRTSLPPALLRRGLRLRIERILHHLEMGSDFRDELPQTFVVEVLRLLLDRVDRTVVGGDYGLYGVGRIVIILIAPVGLVALFVAAVGGIGGLVAVVLSREMGAH